MSGWAPGQRLWPLSLDLSVRRAVQAVATTRDYYPARDPANWAPERMFLFLNTMFLRAFIGRAACEWFGHDAFLRRVDMSMRAPNHVGRTLVAEGTVTGIRESGGCRLLDAEVTLSTEDGPTTAVRLTVQLPVPLSPWPGPVKPGGAVPPPQ